MEAFRSNPFISDIASAIRRSNIFSHVMSSSHVAYQIFHQLIPQSLLDLISRAVTKNPSKVCIAFMDFAFITLVKPLWRMHHQSF